MVQEVDMKNDEGMYKRASIRTIYELLTGNGFEDVAEFLKEYIGECNSEKIN